MSPASDAIALASAPRVPRRSKNIHQLRHPIEFPGWFRFRTTLDIPGMIATKIHRRSC
jgi:hypothetical protein